MIMTPAELAHVDQHMGDADKEVDRFVHVYTVGAEQRGDAQSVLDLGKFLSMDFTPDVLAVICAMAVRRIARSS